MSKPILEKNVSEERIHERMRRLCSKLGGEWRDRYYECIVPYWVYDEDFLDRHGRLIAKEISEIARSGIEMENPPSLVIETAHLIGCKKERVYITPEPKNMIVEITAEGYDGYGIEYEYVDFLRTKWDETVSKTCKINRKIIEGIGEVREVPESMEVVGFGRANLIVSAWEFKAGAEKYIYDVQDCAYEAAEYARNELIKLKRKKPKTIREL